MSKEKGFVRVTAKGFVERLGIAWKVLCYGYIEFDYELLEGFAKSYIKAERKKNAN